MHNQGCTTLVGSDPWTFFFFLHGSCNGIEPGCTPARRGLAKPSDARILSYMISITSNHGVYKQNLPMYMSCYTYLKLQRLTEVAANAQTSSCHAVDDVSQSNRTSKKKLRETPCERWYPYVHGGCQPPGPGQCSDHNRQTHQHRGGRHGHALAYACARLR